MFVKVSKTLGRTCGYLCWWAAASGRSQIVPGEASAWMREGS